jgi:hypothetical protein
MFSARTSHHQDHLSSPTADFPPATTNATTTYQPHSIYSYSPLLPQPQPGLIKVPSDLMFLTHPQGRLFTRPLPPHLLADFAIFITQIILNFPSLRDASLLKYFIGLWLICLYYRLKC